jgi:hypothetical protein
MVRGDSKAYKFQRKDREGNILTDTPTTLFFTVKTSFKTQEYVLQKNLENMYITQDGYWHFVLNPEDTEDLPYGKYCWDIQVVQDGFKTTIARGYLVLTDESTWEVNENA